MTKLQPKLSTPVIREMIGSPIKGGEMGLTAQLIDQRTGELVKIGKRGNPFAGDDAE
jgi:hypothetical protein